MAKKSSNNNLKIRFGGFNYKRKKTRQGRSVNTKLKSGQKRYRGQGK